MDESDPEPDDSGEEEPAKAKKKLPILTRADITSSRKTSDGSGVSGGDPWQVLTSRSSLRGNVAHVGASGMS